MLWDPKGFPFMLYEMNKYEGSSAMELLDMYPFTSRLFFKGLFSLQSLGILPRSFGKVNDMKKLSRLMLEMSVKKERSGILEYRKDESSTDEHYFRVYENADCTGFENIGSTLAFHVPSMLAGYCSSEPTTAKGTIGVLWAIARRTKPRVNCLSW